jgi:hypothetical protein
MPVSSRNAGTDSLASDQAICSTLRSIIAPTSTSAGAVIGG